MVIMVNIYFLASLYNPYDDNSENYTEFLSTAEILDFGSAVAVATLIQAT